MRSLALLFLCAILAACGRSTPIPSARDSGELVVLTRNGPTTYFENAQGQPAGFEYDLAALFAKELGLKLRIVTATNFHEILPLVSARQAHLAAAGITITDERKKQVLFSTAYQAVQQELVFNTNLNKPADLKAASRGRLVIVAGTSYAERLLRAKRAIPELKWTEVKDQQTEELLTQLADGTGLDYVIADSNIVQITQNFHPTLAVAFPVGRSEYLAWAFPKDGDAWLYKKSVEFFARIQHNGTLKRLLDRYYGHVERLESADVSAFLSKMQTVLPRYRPLFQEAQEITGIDWRLLAALGYQESKWEPLATSPTGVRGIMMLTEDTADAMGVKDRLDPKQSIMAGAKYLLTQREAIPPRITEPDRTWMAMASYNVGYGHLEDARVLAARQSLNADAWTDLKKTLPLLAQTQFNTTVKHGFARGGEPVIFTENVRTYYDILVKYEKPYKPLFSPFSKRSDKAQKISLR